MTSIFERALGPDFERLHARLRERLSIELERGSGCVASGVMSRVWHGTPLLKPLLYLSALDHLLFPEEASTCRSLWRTGRCAICVAGRA